MRAGQQIPEHLLSRSVSGVNLVPGTLPEQIGTDVTLLVFLRQLGCMFCRETISDMKALSASDRHFPAPLFFFQGGSTEGRALLRRSWPRLRAIADPTAEFYQGFGIRRGGLSRMFGPGVWSAKARAEGKGHANGERSGDIWRMPGVFLAKGDQIFWAHEYRHAGDHPDYDHISRLSGDASLEEVQP